jgi:ABC-type transport system involved in multi-copper enzyme maturation permease subunit
LNKPKFVINLTWELKNLFRFPFPEVLLALFTYMIFLPRGGGFSFSVSSENLVWNGIARNIAFHTASRAARFSFFAYIPLAIFTSIFATLVFAHEIENGLMKVHLSHAISKRSLFVAKLLSCFLIVFMTFSVVLLSNAFLEIPENSLYLILSPDLILRVLFVAMLQSLFLISIGISFSLYSGKTSVSLIGSFAIFYIFQLLSENANLEFLPPTAFREQAYFILSKTSPSISELPNFLILPLISVFFIVFSYLFFSRRLEIS